MKRKCKRTGIYLKNARTPPDRRAEMKLGLTCDGFINVKPASFDDNSRLTRIPG